MQRSHEQILRDQTKYWQVVDVLANLCCVRRVYVFGGYSVNIVGVKKTEMSRCGTDCFSCGNDADDGGRHW